MNLKERRIERKLSQMDISKVLQIPQTTYSRYEQGICEPSISTLIKLADFYNISIDELVGRPTHLINLNAIKPTKSRLIEQILAMNELQELRTTAYVAGLLGE